MFFLSYRKKVKEWLHGAPLKFLDRKAKSCPTSHQLLSHSPASQSDAAASAAHRRSSEHTNVTGTAGNEPPHTYPTLPCLPTHPPGLPSPTFTLPTPTLDPRARHASPRLPECPDRVAAQGTFRTRVRIPRPSPTITYAHHIHTHAHTHIYTCDAVANRPQELPPSQLTRSSPTSTASPSTFPPRRPSRRSLSQYTSNASLSLSNTVPRRYSSENMAHTSWLPKPVTISPYRLTSKTYPRIRKPETI